VADESEIAEPAPKKALSPALMALAFVIPVVGLVELALFVRESTDVVSDADWLAAREAVKKDLTPEDLVVFAPGWIDPVGRRYFGPDIMTFDRAARADESRFRRAFEVAFHGDHRSEVKDWKNVSEGSYGKLTVRRLENPHFAPVITDFLARAEPPTLSVTRAEPSGTEAACTWVRGPVQSAGIYYPAGPATPGNKFVCPSTFVGITVIQALDHSPRRCIAAFPPGGTSALRMTFAGVKLGKSIVAHHGIHYDGERYNVGTPVTIVFRTRTGPLGQSVHRDGQGWSSFELDTTELAGKTEDIIVEVSSSVGMRRQYCFEATTR